MSTPNASKSSDATATIGTLLSDSGQRDAIHVAVVSVVAGQKLKPGDHVGFLGDRTVGHCSDPVGIVDPFLDGSLKMGDRFWLAIYPRQITSLRHVWSHPKIVDETTGGMCGDIERTGDRAASEAWIKEFADRYDLTYTQVMKTASIRADGGYDYITGGEELEGECVPDEFWDHFEKATGQPVKEDNRNNFFSCSC